MAARWPALAAFLVITAACDGKDAQPEGAAQEQEPATVEPDPDAGAFVPEQIACDDDPERIAFGEIYEVLQVSCVSIGCHSGSNIGNALGNDAPDPAGDFDLTTGPAAFASLLKPATSCDGPRIKPGSAEESVLIKRLEGTGCGPQMPQNADPMPKEFIDKVKTWINEGAVNDLPSQCGVADAKEAKGPTFTEVYTRVLKPSCGGVWCHDPYQSPDEARLDTSSQANAYFDLVNVRSVCQGEGSELLRVAPGDAENSMLVAKLEDRGCGMPMPVDIAGTPQLLDPELIKLVRDWIDAGAANN